MKILILFGLLITSSITYSQQYSDTIYYKSGKIQVGKIFDEDILSIKYRYLHKSGKEKIKTAEKQDLIKYRIGDQSNSRFSNYTSKELPREKKDRYMSRNKANAIIVGATGAFVVFFTWVLFVTA